MKGQNLFDDLNKDLNKKIFKLAKDLIIRVCNDLGKPNKADHLIEKYLNDTDKKEPEKVKRSKSAFLFFTEDYREKIKKKYPGDGMIEINKKLGKLWEKLKEKDRTKYLKLAEKDKERYKKEMKNTKTKLNGLLTSDKTLEISCIKDELYDNSDSDDSDSCDEESLDNSNDSDSNSDSNSDSDNKSNVEDDDDSSDSDEYINIEDKTDDEDDNDEDDDEDDDEDENDSKKENKYIYDSDDSISLGDSS
tara:strand:- start:43 stop:786 length:744 start_codon:yes stop_codon:yes gene_type:complete